jgi:putative membrane protein
LLERDPRVYFAAERTLLAWVRTGVAVIGLGFVVARLHPEPNEAGLARGLGGGLSLAGGIMTAVATLEFKLILRRLLPEQLPQPHFGAQLGTLLALGMACVGVLLGAYLLS